MSKTQRFVVGYDYSRQADAALRSAFDYASREERGEVHVVHVVVTPPDFVPEALLASTPLVGTPLGEAAEALEARVGQAMAEWQEQTQRTFSRLSVHVRRDFPAREIVQLATDLEADLVVVGTHGRGGVARFLIGSVADAVLRMAPCPVLVVRVPDGEPVVPVIEPPCPACVTRRKETGGRELWCEQHSEHHGQRHVYHYESRVATPSNAPLFVRQG